jgi:outer membrane immunogenic protein
VERAGGSGAPFWSKHVARIERQRNPGSAAPLAERSAISPDVAPQSCGKTAVTPASCLFCFTVIEQQHPSGETRDNILRVFGGAVMKKLTYVFAVAGLIGTPAFAAEMPVKAPPLAPAPIYNWTGFYAGLNAGWGWDRNNVAFTGDGTNGAGNDFISRVFDGPLSFNPITRSLGINSNGAIGGAQIGYNWQFGGSWLAGFEADIQASGIKGDTTVKSPTVGLQLTAHQDLNWFGTVRGRLGYLATERLLVFGTGGLAYAAANDRADFFTTGFGGAIGATAINCGPAPSVCLAGQNTETKAGWTAGGGVEWALSAPGAPFRTTIKVEYLHIALPDSTLVMTTAGTAATGNGTVAATFHNNFDLVRGGFNVRF